LTRIRHGDSRHRNRNAQYLVGPSSKDFQALSGCFNWLLKRDDTLLRSPLDGVDDPSPEVSRDRVLADAELAALWSAAEADGSLFGRLVQLLILTACRRDEVRDAEWREFDFDSRTWLIPGHRVKNGRDHLLPLSDTAVAMLDKLPRLKGRHLLFSTTGETPISGLSKAKARMHEGMARELGVEPARWTLHDIRRSVVTGLQRLGISLEVTEAVVNHRSGTLAGVTSVYARHGYLEEKRRALDCWAAHVMAIVSGEPAANNVSYPNFGGRHE
jgi:integrase